MKVEVLVLLIVFGASLSEGGRTYLMARAVANLTQLLFEQDKKIVIVNFGIELVFLDLLTLHNLKHNLIPYEIRSSLNGFYGADNGSFKLCESAVLTFDSMASLKDFNIKFELTNKFSKTLVFFVFCVGAIFDDISTLKEPLVSMREKRKGLFVNPNEMQHILQFQYFIVEEEDSIRLVTFVFYSPESCGEPKLLEVNRFDKKKKMWKTSNWLVTKFDNFNGCPLVFGVWFQGNAMDYWAYDNGYVSYDGYNLGLLYDLQRPLNFTVVLNPRVWPELTYLYTNVSVDLLAMEHCYNNYDDKHDVLSFITYPYVFKEHRLAVPPGDNYSGYEKLFLPFDLDTWVLIIATFLAAFITIFLLKFATENVSNFVFGRNVDTPLLNVAAHFFGLSQYVLPRRNFARFLMISFILYSLIIRTAWQGKMFEFMMKNMTKAEIHSVEELIEKNYTFHMHYGFSDWYMDLYTARG